MNTAERISVLLAEDHTIIREGLKALLADEDDIEVVGEAATGREAVSLIQKLRPAVVVMDIAMPQLNGLEAMRQIREDLPDTKVIILSAHENDLYVDRAAELGASGYLIKQTSVHFLSEAIRRVHQGHTVFSPAVSNRINERRQESLDREGPSKAKSAQLNSREAEVLQLIAEGGANKQIAETLCISIKAVEKRRAQITRKLDIHNTAGLTRYAVAAGIIESRARLSID